MIYLYLDVGFTSTAQTEEQAREEARLWFIEALKNDEVQFNVEDE